MKNTSACPKCESADIIRVPGTLDMGFWLTLPIYHNRIPLKSWAVTPKKTMVLVTRIVCTECGFSEEWIEGAEDITKLKKSYGPEKKPKFPSLKSKLPPPDPE